jgi:hypothetical protein
MQPTAFTTTKALSISIAINTKHALLFLQRGALPSTMSHIGELLQELPLGMYEPLLSFSGGYGQPQLTEHTSEMFALPPVWISSLPNTQNHHVVDDLCTRCCSGLTAFLCERKSMTESLATSKVPGLLPYGRKGPVQRRRHGCGADARCYQQKAGESGEAS